MRQIFKSSVRIFSPTVRLKFFLIDNHLKHIYEQECIPVECVPPTRYHTGGLPNRDPYTETSRQRPPDRDPLDRDPLDRETPWIETLPPPGKRLPWTKTPR